MKTIAPTSCAARPSRRRRFFAPLVAVGLLTLGSSCQSLQPAAPDEVLMHALVIKFNGEWADPRDKLSDKSLGSNFPAKLDLRTQLKLMAANIRTEAEKKRREGKQLKILVFVHGGLNTLETSSAAYRRLHTLMEDEGYYPIFIIWNSGLLSTYGDRFWRVRQGEDSPYLAPATSLIVAPIDLITALVRTPLVWSSEIHTDLRTVEWDGSPQRKDHEAVEKFLTKSLGESVAAGTDGRRRADRAAHGAIYAGTFVFKLATSPIIDGFGSKAWDMMLRRTQTMFHPPIRGDVFARLAAKRDILGVVDPSNLPDNWRDDIIANWYNGSNVDEKDDAPVGAMWAFSRALRAWSHEKDIQVDLFGHSMGTIVLNELLREVPDITVNRIGYLAAACTIADWERSVWPYLNSPAHCDTQFYGVSLHRMREQSETNFFDIPPRGSLLNWIDNFLANPTTISERTFGSWDNLVRVLPQYAVEADDLPRTHKASTPAAQLSQIHLRSLDALPGDVFKDDDRQPQKHGDFTDWPFWRAEFLWPKSPGDMPRRISSAPGQPTT